MVAVCGNAVLVLPLSISLLAMRNEIATINSF